MSKTSMQILYDYIVEMENTYRKKSKESKDKDFKKGVEAVITATTLIRVKMKDGGFQHEKEQIVKAHYHNRCLNDQTYECSIRVMKEAEEYFKEYYKQKK